MSLKRRERDDNNTLSIIEQLSPKKSGLSLKDILDAKRRKCTGDVNSVTENEFETKGGNESTLVTHLFINILPAEEGAELSGRKRKRHKDHYSVSELLTFETDPLFELHSNRKRGRLNSEKEVVEDETEERKKEIEAFEEYVKSLPKYLVNGCEDTDEKAEDDETFRRCDKKALEVLKVRFRERKNEVMVDNGSEGFFLARVGKVSASKIGTLAGLSPYDSPWAYCLDLEAKFPDNRFTSAGKREEPRTRLALVERLPKNVTLRKCGIFVLPDGEGRFTAMPDDLGINAEGEEFVMEYKFITYPSQETARPHPMHLAQCTWQMASVGSKTRAYLVYNLGHSHTIQGIKLVVWVVEYSEEFYQWLRGMADKTVEYIKNPTRDNMVKVPWMACKKSVLEYWVDGKASVETFPSSPNHYTCEVSEIGLSLEKHRSLRREKKCITLNLNQYKRN